ncbi:hypothetical protein IC220_02455 [Wolbachia endosymbiont of Pentalonia nigronervosa]|jgi:hypothetical protein|nr:hypothetical protein [Wolbachia endosymbiont of Pentalonia nigronervosa]MBD0391321.1 hypothetical protein [Wolbachia endosymbiont of Pentalonia nigronervosa]
MTSNRELNEDLRYAAGIYSLNRVKELVEKGADCKARWRYTTALCC